jgi:hypothetical protein
VRKTIAATTTGVVLCLSLYLNAGPEAATADCKVRLRLVDTQTGQSLGGLVRIFRAGQAEPLQLPGLFDRLRGLERSTTVAGWYVLPATGAETTLPRAKLRLEAIAGLESASGRQEIDLTGGNAGEVTVPLRLLFRPDQLGLAAGNTHLHLRGMSLAQANEYLRQIPAADGLKVLFISHLERHSDDEHYITNRYPVGDLKQFGPPGVLISNGEEHRHNFGAYGQGFGHVMLLAIKQLVQPVSLGPGITEEGNDDRPLGAGIEEARRQGGTVIWCHNASGHEGVPNTLAGRVDALNVFDGSRADTFEETYYRYLNIGLRLPLSTGTDWFLYDFARVYAKIQGPLTTRSWLDAVKAGRGHAATNGPLLSLSVNGLGPGEVIDLDRPQAVRVEATGIGRHDFRQLQLVQNGRVVQHVRAESKHGGWSARLVAEIRLEGPSWFAVRIDTPTRNEFDCRLFAHSSPVYVNIAGKSVFDLEAARGLLRRVEEARADIYARGKFSGSQAQDKILALYDKAAQELRERMGARGK